MLKRLLLILIVSVVGYFAYTYYSTGSLTLPSVLSNRIPSTPSFSKKSDLTNILGTTTSSLFQKGTDLLNNVTGGHAEPIINKAVSDLQERIKDLPEQEYKKVKYEFCKDVLPSPAPAIN